MHQDMYTCPPDLQCLFHPLWIVIWKPGYPSVGLWLCLNDPTSVPIPWLECAHASVHVHMSTWLPMSASPTNQMWELRLDVKPPIRGGSSNWRWDHWSEVGAPIGHETSDLSSHLWLELPTLIGGPTSNWSSHLWLEVSSLIGDPTSNWRSQLQSEVSPLIGAPTSWRYFSYHLGWSQYLIISRTRKLD